MYLVKLNEMVIGIEELDMEHARERAERLFFILAARLLSFHSDARRIFCQ